MEPLQVVLFHAVEKNDAVMQVGASIVYFILDFAVKSVQGHFLPFCFPDQINSEYPINGEPSDDKHYFEQPVHPDSVEGHADSCALHPGLIYRVH
jgi:hypothetical protein